LFRHDIILNYNDAQFVCIDKGSIFTRACSSTIKQFLPTHDVKKVVSTTPIAISIYQVWSMVLYYERVGNLSIPPFVGWILDHIMCIDLSFLVAIVPWKT
jgi:hypothetical protein